MKYCPYCGAGLLEDAAFCMECGKTIPVSTGKAPEKERKRPQTKTQEKRFRRLGKAAPVEPEPDPQDVGYDGYYDDTPVSDNGAYKEKMDRELITRIILVGVSALILVALAILLMRLL